MCILAESQQLEIQFVLSIKIELEVHTGFDALPFDDILLVQEE